MKLIDDWHLIAWRSATTWVTFAVQSVLATVTVHWAILLGLLPFLPFYLQLPLALIVAAVVTMPTLIARLTRQDKLDADLLAKKDARDGTS